MVILNLNSAKVLCEMLKFSVHPTNGLSFLNALILTKNLYNQSLKFCQVANDQNLGKSQGTDFSSQPSEKPTMVASSSHTSSL